ncbi:hypothetical protein SARC_01294 [Sphaeroforma arctica JP610]|uniref:ER membrane protein complex subunit 6 n=1 Tax=Sphaeroforma arctica JP610 TaxID=667725 RepID=A0A0L0GCG7_9EUKA|nr:hypothetical protein SARC_01294 [Sphaeroforma arctica JP610]KNC86571.1 hypothetical protein SARC_01294 [Sphaeroforma arctica JP610]|eukprot:XP_014160473.1 hypothetical protein SARC_01294 [Sphaeroforma arctica JP610]
MGPKSRRQVTATRSEGPPKLAGKEDSETLSTQLVDDIPDLDEFMDLIFHSRMLLAVVCGLVFGITAMQGSVPIAIYLVTSLVLGLGLPMFRGLNANDFGGEQSFMNEAVAPALGIFFAVWVVTYNIVHQ